MKKMTAIILTLFLACGTMMGCQKTAPGKETIPQETKPIVHDDKKPVEPIEIELGKEYNLTSLPNTAFIKGPMDLTVGSLADAFDNDPATIADFGVEGGEDYWVGIRLEQPAILTKVEMHAPGYKEDGSVNRPHVLYGAIVEGSNDGTNWEFILQLGDNYSEYEDYAWDMADGLGDWFDEEAFDGEDEWDNDAMSPVPYTYYRVWNDTKGSAIYGDIRLYGYFGDPMKITVPETEATETETASTGILETDVFWEFVQKDVNGEKYTYLETNADVPASIEEFREPSVEPAGLIKKVLEQKGDYHLIIYVQSEDDSYIDAMYAFWQKPIPSEGEAIGEGDGNADYTTEVNGYEALYHERQNKGLVLIWHDDQYYYNLSCLDKSVTLDELIKIAESVE